MRLPTSTANRTAKSDLPLFRHPGSDSGRTIIWAQGRAVSVHDFAKRVIAMSAQLPFRNDTLSVAARDAAMINLCEDRGNFMLAYCAALLAEHATLLPASRAPKAIRELESSYATSYRIDDATVRSVDPPANDSTLPLLNGEQVAMIGFTSGSTGVPHGFAKTWASLSTGTKWTEQAIRRALSLDVAHATPSIVATVPPQHMYGMELSVLQPLLGGMSVHSERPLFPADIGQALSEVTAPRILVTTPIHLRSLVASGIDLPPLAGVISATAPLDRALAVEVEARFATVMFEVFGSTETGVIATRKTAQEEAWRLHPDVEVTPRPDGILVMTPWFAEPMVLQDIVELLPQRRFMVRGRNADFVDVAGKRASLGELTRRLLAVEGVHDAVVFPPDVDASGRVPRVAAAIVAPGLDVSTVLSRLSASVDHAFLPRPLLIVEKLPRNEIGKLPRDRLLALLRRET